MTLRGVWSADGAALTGAVRTDDRSARRNGANATAVAQLHPGAWTRVIVPLLAALVLMAALLVLLRYVGAGPV